MATKKNLKKRSLPKKKTLKRFERGRIFEKPLFIVFALIVVVIGLSIFFKPWKYLNLPFISTPVVVTKPTMDMARAISIVGLVTTTGVLIKGRLRYFHGLKKMLNPITTTMRAKTIKSGFSKILPRSNLFSVFFLGRDRFLRFFFVAIQ